MDNIVEADDPRAIGCPQLGIPPNGGERFLNLAIFGGRKAGQQIFVVHISAFANRQLHPFTLGMTDIYVIKSDPDVFKFQNAITITAVHFVDIQSSVVMGRFIIAEAIREQLYNTGAMGVFTTVKNINATKPFWQYLCNKLQPLTINGYVSQTTKIDHRVKRIEHAFGIHKESIKLNLQAIYPPLSCNSSR